MSEFKASNGWCIDKYGEMRDGVHYKILDAPDAVEAQQFFLEERDHELGRWRDKEQPGYVVYRRDANSVLVVDEANGATKYFLAPTVVSETREGFDGAARRFYAAHPQHKSLPTKPGVYGCKGLFRDDVYSSTLELTQDGRWVKANSSVDMTAAAQSWADLGELVRLVPECGDEQ